MVVYLAPSQYHPHMVISDVVTEYCVVVKKLGVVRVVRFGEGSRLLATREAGWAAPAHRVGRLQGWALGRPRWPSLTVMREGTHGLTTSPLRSH